MNAWFNSGPPPPRPTAGYVVPTRPRPGLAQDSSQLRMFSVLPPETPSAAPPPNGSSCPQRARAVPRGFGQGLGATAAAPPSSRRAQPPTQSCRVEPPPPKTHLHPSREGILALPPAQAGAALRSRRSARSTTPFLPHPIPLIKRSLPTVPLSRSQPAAERAILHSMPAS